MGFWDRIFGRKKEEPVEEELPEGDADLDVGGWSADGIGAISRRKQEGRR